MRQGTLAETLRWAFSGDPGASGRVVISWTLAGGAVTGGVLMGVLALLGRGNPGLLVLVGPALFVAGSLMGLLHGLALGAAWRPPGVSRRDALHRAGWGVAASVSLLPLSWLTSAAITVGWALQAEFRLSWLLVGSVGWLLAGGVCCWAAVEGCGHVRRAYGRCRRRHAGLLLTVLVAIGGALALERLGPAMPVFGRAPGWHLSIALSVLLTIWLWVPFLYVALQEPVPSEPRSPDRGRA